MEKKYMHYSGDFLYFSLVLSLVTVFSCSLSVATPVNVIMFYLRHVILDTSRCLDLVLISYH